MLQSLICVNHFLKSEKSVVDFSLFFESRPTSHEPRLLSSPGGFSYHEGGHLIWGDFSACCGDAALIAWVPANLEKSRLFSKFFVFDLAEHR